MPDKVALELASQISRQNVAKEGWTTYYVDGATGNDGSNGLTWESALLTIQAAVDKASSWAKIYITDGTYAENVVVPSTKRRIRFEGSAKSGVVAAPSSGHAFEIAGDRCEITNLTTTSGSGTNQCSIYLNGADECVINRVICSGTGTNPYGVHLYKSSKCDISEVEHGTGVSQIIRVEGTASVISRENEIHHNYIDGGDYGVYLGDYAQFNKVHNGNTIQNSNNYNVYVSGAQCWYNQTIHNYLMTNNKEAYDGATVGMNLWRENYYYAKKAFDLDKDDICEPYIYGGTTEDYSPLSLIGADEVHSLGTNLLRTARGSGIEMFDSFDYVSDAKLLNYWRSNAFGTIPTLTRSTTSYAGRYAMQAATDVGATESQVYTFLAPKDFFRVKKITMAVRCNDTSQPFSIRITDPRLSYAGWDFTTNSTADTYEIHTLDLSTTPDTETATQVDRRFICRLEIHDLAAGKNYLFDEIKFYHADTEIRRDKLLFPSDLKTTITIPVGAATQTLPPVTIPSGAFPSGATIDKVYCHFLYGSRYSAGDSKVNAEQHIQLEEAGAGFTNAIKIVDDSFWIDSSEATMMGGNLVLGNIEVSSTVDAENKTYNFQWLNANMETTAQIFYDVQTIIEVRWH